MPLAIALAVGGFALLAFGTGMIVAGVAHPHAQQAAAAAAATGLGATTASIAVTDLHPYPLHLAGRLDADLSRWRWLVKWFLAIPHLIVLVFLWIAFSVLTLVAFFAILFKFARGGAH